MGCTTSKPKKYSNMELIEDTILDINLLGSTPLDLEYVFSGAFNNFVFESSFEVILNIDESSLNLSTSPQK